MQRASCPTTSEIEMRPAHLPCGNPHGLRRTIRHIVFYFQLFLSECYLAFWGNLCACAAARFSCFFFAWGSGEDVMECPFWSYQL